MAFRTDTYEVYASCRSGEYLIGTYRTLAEAEHVAYNIRRYVPDAMRDELKHGLIKPITREV